MKKPDTLYHYTSVQALAHILSSRKIRFTRLDCLNDKNEGLSDSELDFTRTTFVSCWTDSERESIPHWHIYSGAYRGVRLGITGELAQRRKITKHQAPEFMKETGEVDASPPSFPYYSWLGPEQLHQGDTVIAPPDADAPDDWPLKVRYVGEKELQQRVQQPSDNSGWIPFQSNKVGRVKHRDWVFESEWRFKLFGAAAPPNQWDFYAPDRHVFVPIRRSTFENIEITLGPKFDPGDRILVEALINRHCPTATLVQSALTGLIE